jgi:uncharacterized protein YqeY
MNKKQLQVQLQLAIKAKDEVNKTAYQTIISEIDLLEAKQVVNTKDILSIIRKERDKFNDASIAFKATKPELSEKYEMCSTLLTMYLPTLIPETDYKKIYFDVTAELKENFKIGDVMKGAKNKYGDMLDMSSFSEYVKGNI